MPPQEQRINPKEPKNGFSSTAYGLAIIAALIVVVGASVYAIQWHDTGNDHSRNNKGGTASYDLAETRPGWWETSAFIYFDIPARVLFQAPEDKKSIDPEELAEKIWAEFDRIGNIFNPFDPDSETARLNEQRRSGSVPVSEEIHEVLLTAESLWETADGAFDPTMLPVKQMWEEAVASQKIPSHREIKRTMAHAGFDKVEVAPDTPEITLDNKNIQFDFGGIAKGYAVDKVTALLRREGIDAALVSLAGEIRTFGKNNDKPWRIGIQHPVDMNALWGIVSAHGDIRLSTSGNYRQPLRIAGREFYHIFDPATGRPVSETILGVTTLCNSQKTSSARLDGAATAIVVMGADAGIRFAEKMGIEALVLKRGRDGEIKEVMTEGFQTVYEGKL